LLTALVCLQTADLICTYLLLSGGRTDAYEANPLARTVLEVGGWLGLGAFKLAVTGVALTACAALARKRAVVAVRVLAGLCVVMFGVNAYSGTLLASPDPVKVAVDQANAESDGLDDLISRTHAFSRERNELCDAVLEGTCETAEATARLDELLRKADLKLPAAARLPDPDQPAEVSAYFHYHLQLRARVRGLNGRVAHREVPEPNDVRTPRWVALMDVH
jgi:hypothetical protein